MKDAAICLLFLASTVGLTACGAAADPGPDPRGAPETSPPTPETPTPETPASGLPCDVHAMMQTYCAGCHVGEVYAITFSTRENLLAPYKNSTLGAVAATEVRELRMPKHGSTWGLPTGAERDLLVAWVAAGMPAGSCGKLTDPMR